MKKKLLEYSILLFPFIDVITALLIQKYDVTITPGVIIKGLFMVILGMYVLFSKSKYNRVSIISYIIFFLYVVGYFGFKPELLSSSFLMGELQYLFRLMFFPIVFFGLLCFYDEYEFDKKRIVKLLFYSLIFYVILLLVPLLFDTAYTTYPAHLKGHIGWFYSGNEIANIMIILCPLMYYYIGSKSKWLIALVVVYTILSIGTKVSMLGLVIVSIIAFIFILIKEKRLKSSHIIESFIVLVITLLFSYNSYAVYNYKYIKENRYPTTNIVIDETNKEEVNNVIDKMEDFYLKNEFTKIFKTILSSRDVYLANTISIYNNDPSSSGIWFGIGFSNTDIVNNNNITKFIEIDVLDAFFHYGLFGLLIMLEPLLYTVYLVISKKGKLNINSYYYILLLLLFMGISSFSGHLYTSPAVTIYVVFYLLLLINEKKLLGRSRVLEDKVSILALHMGYGGIERSIVNQANMICKSHKTEIICLYQTVDEIPYKLDNKVKLVYLSDVKPNREEFLKEYHNKNIVGIFKEGFKSIKVLYLKRKLVSDYIYNSDSRVIISTRIEFTKLLNKYHNKGAKTVAEEHVYHHEDMKYINKLKSALSNIDYLIPASKYLTNDYRKYIKKCKVVYIAQTIDKMPKFTNKCKDKNITSVGRLVSEKGFNDLIEVMKLINNKDKSIKLTIAGDGVLYNELNDLIKKNHLSKVVNITGYLDSKKLDALYKKSSLFVMTSLEESFGLVLIEAMSYGIPCYAFDSALGAKEIINGKNGLLVSNRDKNVMADEIIAFFDKNNDKMIKEAKKTASLYESDNVVKDWNNFIDKLL